MLTRPMPHFRWHMKQRGAVLAKGRLLGLQFQALLEDGLYFDPARRANDTGLPPPGRVSRPWDIPSRSPLLQPAVPGACPDRRPLRPSGRAMGFEFEAERVMGRGPHHGTASSPAEPLPESAIDDLLNALAQCQ
ncbi:MAG: hypothetical protein ACLT1A_06295 [Dysosmobacter sp.]